MTKTEERFLEAYRCALMGECVSGSEDAAPDNVAKNMAGRMTAGDWRQVFALADSHRIFPMVFEAVWPGSDDPASDTPFFRKGLAKAERLTCGQARMSAEFLKLYRFLRKRGLSPIVMKGIICRNLYPQPEQRSSSDEDLLIPEEAFPLYHKAFSDYGLQVALPGVDIENSHEIPYCNGQVYIELHKKPFPPESKAYGDLNRFFADVEDHKTTEQIYGVPVSTMDCTDHLFYQICHAYKHFLNCGFGIRLVSDIVLFSMAYLDRIDWEAVTENCREIQAFDFASAVFGIGEKHLLPDRFPKRLRDIWDTENTDEAALLGDILAGGVYGTSSTDRLHSANLTLSAAGSAGRQNRASVFLQTLFPPFRSMKNRYPWLRRLPFLLPAAWLHRIFSYGLGGIRRGQPASRPSEAVRIGNERIALMRQYRMVGEKNKKLGPLKRLYKWSHTSALAPVLKPFYVIVSMAEYHLLNLKWFLGGDRKPSRAEQALVRENVTIIIKSFERQHLARGLCRNISRMYPGTAVIIADDSRAPLEISNPAVKVIRLPFNSGLGAGLAAALEEVRTPYVMRLDDDELLTLRTKLHRELKYLMRHPKLDLIGFGHTTAIRLHSPAFNFREYYKTPMEDAPHPLKIPHMTKPDENHIVLGKVANIYLARTEKVREVGFDPNIRVIDHHEFFWRAAGIITSAVALDTVVFHRHNPYERGYNTYRSDYAADLEYIKKKRKRIIQEAKKNEKAHA